jgi:hypothetical protein
MPEHSAAALVQNLDQQSCHPVLVFGASAYSEAPLPTAGWAGAGAPTVAVTIEPNS